MRETVIYLTAIHIVLLFARLAKSVCRRIAQNEVSYLVVRLLFCSPRPCSLGQLVKRPHNLRAPKKLLAPPPVRIRIATIRTINVAGWLAPSTQIRQWGLPRIQTAQTVIRHYSWVNLASSANTIEWILSTGKADTIRFPGPTYPLVDSSGNQLQTVTINPGVPSPRYNVAPAVVTACGTNFQGCYYNYSVLYNGNSCLPNLSNGVIFSIGIHVTP